MSKPMIISHPMAAVAIDARKFVKQDGSGAVTTNDGAATAIGISESKADNSATPDYKYKAEDIGVIKQGIVTVPVTAAAAYNIGDVVELDTDGQTVKAGTTNPIGTAAETKTTASGDLGLKVYVNFA